MDKKKIIVCIGMKRSGSTLQFNIVREVLECAGIDFENVGYIHYDDIFDVTNNEKSRNILLKCHNVKAIEALRSYQPIVFYTYRDLRDVYLSGKEKVGWKVEGIPELVDELYQGYLWVNEQDVPCLIQQYESMFTDRVIAVQAVASFLGITLSEKQISEITRNVSALGKRLWWQTCLILIRQFELKYLRRFLGQYAGYQKMKLFLSNLIKAKLIGKKTQIHYDHISRRKGVPGGWRDSLTCEELGVFDRYKKEMEAMNYD